MDHSLNFLVKRYFNNNLNALAKIHKLSQKKGFAYYYEIEQYLNRGKNQVSTILLKLERDQLITRDKKNRPQIISISLLGKQLINEIQKKL